MVSVLTLGTITASQSVGVIVRESFEQKVYVHLPQKCSEKSYNSSVCKLVFSKNPNVSIVLL